MNGLKWKIYCTLLCFISLRSKAQLSLGVGPELSFPLMYNDEVGSYHHALGAFGIHAMVNYIPANTNFFPSLTASSAAERLPILKVGATAVNIKFFQSDIILYANLKKELNRAQFYYGLGIGAAYFNSKGIALSGERSSIISVYTTSPDIKTWTPSFNIKAEYIMPLSNEKPLEMGIGFNLQYIHFFNNNILSNIRVLDNQYNYSSYTANFKGDVFLPCFQLNIYYKFGISDH